MAAAILHSLKQGAYTAIALYVVFIAVVTVASMHPQLTAPDSVAAQSSLVQLDRAAVDTKVRAS
jgi:site-specific recombinase